jgi:predicted alpha/beta hydrolase family esterase
MRKKKVIFVPGFTGVDGNGWPDWLGRELTKYGFEFSLLPMPNVMCPEVHEWLDFLIEQKIKVNKDTYFIGHSLGCITIARFLEKLSPKKVCGGCIFVSGFCSLPPVPLLADFCTLPLDFAKVKNHILESIVVLSDNDHIIPRFFSEEFSERLGARIIVEHNKGHFTGGVKTLPSVLDSILEIEQMKEEMREIKKLKRFA